MSNCSLLGRRHLYLRARSLTVRGREPAAGCIEINLSFERPALLKRAQAINRIARYASRL